MSTVPDTVRQQQPEGDGVALDGITQADFRNALQRLLDSQTFSGSRRLSKFLRYVGEEAIKGRDSLDQYSIAEIVLDRADDFNPLDDASVRKLASQVRSKLKAYYELEGAADPVIVSLPRRSYIPRIRYRGGEVRAPEPRPAPPRHQPQRLVWTWAAALAAGAIVVIAFASYQFGVSRSAQAAEGDRPAAFRIQSQRGDLRGGSLELAPDAVLIGPSVCPGEEAMVRMRFAPEYATQQAGLMIFADPDNFVRFGSHFKNRTMLEFGLESQGRFQGPEGAYAYDPLGQTGAWRWLSIRCDANESTAFASSDGISWTTFGNPLQVPSPVSESRAAIYAFNGRSNIPSATAEFDDLAVGLSFHNRPAGPLDSERFPGWTVRTTCPEAVAAAIRDGALEITYAPSAIGCEWHLLHQPPAGDWTFTTLLDFVPVSGSSASLVLQGSEDFLSLSRRELNSHSIMLQRRGDNDVSHPDFPGHPLLYLRLTHRDGRLKAGYSRDGLHYVEFADSIKAAELGEFTGIGVGSSIAHWTYEGTRPPARFYHLMRMAGDIDTLP